MRIGIDVGGTNTDAVILDERRRVIAATKQATSADVQTGIAAALCEVMRQSGLKPEAISAVMLGTTHCTNAILERRHLGRIAIIRIGYPAGRAVEPLCTWPSDLLRAVGGDAFVIKGGFEFDGRLIDEPVSETEVRDVARQLKRLGVDEVAIAGIFSPTRSDQEEEVAHLLWRELPQLRCSLSHRIGTLGLLERENSAALNAALGRVAAEAIDGFESALRELDMHPAVYFSQNDGTLMKLDEARRYPIVTIGSGPTNSLRGAAYLSGETDAAVIDVGGTSTDIGILRRGYPRQSAIAVEVGGVRTNFRMPDIVSIALGGGSEVALSTPPRIGPGSVGYRLRERALVFGGDTLTATDVAVACGRHLDAGGDDAFTMQLGLDPAQAGNAYRMMVAMVEDALDRVKTSADDVPAVIVGGGSFMLPQTLQGAARVLRPEHHAHANAIGAAIGAIGAQVDRLYHLGSCTEREAVADATQAAREAAAAAGGIAARSEVIDVESLPIAYLDGQSLRVRVKVSAPIAELDEERVPARP